MSVPLQLAAIAYSVDMLERCAPEHRLTAFKNLCDNNGGVWTLPEPPYPPRAIYDASLFGVSAMADDPELLAKNWIRAARAILLACHDAPHQESAVELFKPASRVEAVELR